MDAANPYADIQGAMTAKVIPIRKRPPTPNEMAAYRWITKGWSEEMKRLILPRYFEHDRK